VVAETTTARVLREMVERAGRGEPEPGTYSCLRCGRDDCRMFTVVLDARGARVEMGELNRLNRFDATVWTMRLKGVLLCPCCSFPHLSGCRHPTKADCPTCGMPTEPAGSWPGGGPFTRCSFDGHHRERADA
jgi:hypothetical protein